jgi:hypothetical protein
MELFLIAVLLVSVINTITSPKRAFMRQESKLAKLCVNPSIKD